jgi:hypothetical protein
MDARQLGIGSDRIAMRRPHGARGNGAGTVRVAFKSGEDVRDTVEVSSRSGRGDGRSRPGNGAHTRICEEGTNDAASRSDPCPEAACPRSGQAEISGGGDQAQHHPGRSA